ncbi:MAG: AraC family transcriptional regulator [Alphaproteobacteria bacterium]|nr:AraC family transcriptional regulator [Alphaproteobacteria bacterium]
MTDPLADVLRAVRLNGGIFLDARLTAPWCVTSKVTVDVYNHLLAPSAQIIGYHVVLQGEVLAAVGGQPPLVVRPGEIVLLPRNEAHMLASAPGLTPVSAEELVQAAGDGGLARIDYGGGGPATHLVCGFLGTVDGYNPLIAALPAMLKLDIREGASRDWVEASVRFAAAELAEGRVGASGTMARLSELLFVEAVRHYAASLDEGARGGLAGLRDPQIGRALALIHRDLATDWTADALAREAALSRSAFMDRFTELVGVPPIRYLTSLRLQSARRELRETRKTIAQLAHGVGYGSEEAFSRAFKREFGRSPRHWRTDGGSPG